MNGPRSFSRAPRKFPLTRDPAERSRCRTRTLRVGLQLTSAVQPLRECRPILTDCRLRGIRADCLSTHVALHQETNQGGHDE